MGSDFPAAEIPHEKGNQASTGLPLLSGTSCVVRTRKLKLQRKHLGIEVLLKLANIY